MYNTPIAMKKLFLVTILSLYTLVSMGQNAEYDHVFFENNLMEGRYYYSTAEYQSPSYIRHIDGKLPTSNKEFYTAKNSLLLNYVSSTQGGWEASIIYPDWRGKDFINKGDNLEFKLFIKSNTTPDELPKIAIGLEKKNQKSDFIQLKDFLIKDKNNWYQVLIPLNKFSGLQYASSNELKKVYLSQNINDGKEHTIYIDQLEITPNQKISVNYSTPNIAAKAYERHVDLTWNKKGLENAKYIKIYRSSNDKDFTAVGIQDPMRGRFADFIGESNKTYKYKITCLDYNYNETAASNIITATTHDMSDDELMTMVQEASFRYYWEGAESNSGLALENIPGRKTMIATGASGFGMMALIVGVERGFITREEGIERFNRIVEFLKKADTYHGGFAHFIDGMTAKTEPFFGNKDNGADILETSFMFQGLLAARQYFDKNNKQEQAIRDGITQLWENIEWNWYKKTPDSKYLYWHWSPDQEWVINHKLIGWNETMITYLMAIASPTHGVSPSMYHTGWASQEQIAQDYRADWGQTRDGSMYTNGNTYFGTKLDVGVSNGGPLFFIHYSYMGMNPKMLRDKYVSESYFENFRNIALINYKYCVENPKKQKGYGANNWGLTASDGPWGYRAAEPVGHQDVGTMAPTGALASFPYLPEQSMDALRHYYRDYGSFLWGEYGFRDAFNLNENWCANIYMGLNQAPVTVMIENHRTSLIWNTFMKDTDIKNMINKVFDKK